jgi:cyclophilin family peptidyl-prolyl cis-trans isomerase
MIEYYSGLAKKYGGRLTARYRNAICLIIDEKTRFEYDGIDIGSEPFYIVDKAHQTRREGFPLDSLSVEMESETYYYDIKGPRSVVSVMNIGFVDFFNRSFKRPLVELIFKGYESIEIELYPEYAPETTKNFIELIRKGYYNDKSLVRSVPKRLIQSGDTSLDPKAWTDDSPGYILDGEFNREGFSNQLSFTKGTLGMAMAAYEVTPYATAGSFFIMTKDEEKLDAIVPAFGKVVKGFDIVERLNDLPTHDEYGYDSPIDPISIDKITVETYGYKYDAPKKVSHDVLND